MGPIRQAKRSFSPSSPSGQPCIPLTLLTHGILLQMSGNAVPCLEGTGQETGLECLLPQYVEGPGTSCLSGAEAECVRLCTET
jgi:hypothetical protein